MNTNIERKGSASLARPLSTLVPLIREEIEAGDAAGIEHYRRAGEMLLEAKGQCTSHGEWVAWVERHFNRSLTVVNDYMKLVEVVRVSPGRKFESLRQAVRPNQVRYPETRPPAWQAPVQRVVVGMDIKALALEEQNYAKERKLVHDLAERLIDIGYKVLASQLHPDKGGSPEAMARLNKVRQLLKGSI